ncbi:LysR family transcriptional regulator [Ralstonia mannitolilytica]|uniref:LysR family transcriptional regulator n=1 Tax=Ralstonia mannitolilytica TaxID=105219 RepID=UPI0028F628C9|nr:LysR family transcriptional regulator [Ralstonia mannitolilytica]CAJ0707957.1 HTH-type transcriptional regulator DmlR [Ralstonia mannitolilytica]
MDMLGAMRLFQKVASTLSFTEAGDLVGLAPSSVSRQIDFLEQHLGVKLLTRTTRRLSLTEAGAAYKAHLDRLLSEIDSVNENISAFSDEPRGRLKVSSPRVFGRKLLAPLLTGFLKTYPQVTLDLTLTDDYVDLIETDTDVVIRIGELGDSSLISRPLGRYRRILVCAPSYLEGRAIPQTPGDLDLHNCLRYRRSGERVVWHFRHRESEGETEYFPDGDLVSNDMDVLLSATQSGIGISLLPFWLVRDQIKEGTLIQIMEDYPLASALQPVGIHFVYLLNRRQSRKVHAFMDFIGRMIGPILI